VHLLHPGATDTVDNGPADDVWVDADGIVNIDLSNGCPLAVEGGDPGPGWPTWWAPSDLNGAVVLYQADRLSGQKPYVSVDGVELVVNYTGRPSPPYPQGCDPQAPGVQFVFGNHGRVQWKCPRCGDVLGCDQCTSQFPSSVLCLKCETFADGDVLNNSGLAPIFVPALTSGKSHSQVGIELSQPREE
jgi:hypothetical protein